MPHPAKIAVEEHFVPRGLEHLITNPGWPPAAWQATLDQLVDVDHRLAEMDRLGVELAVLSLGSNGLQDILDVAEAAEMAAKCNDALAALVAEHPARFAGFAALPMQDPVGAVAELERSVVDLGLRGALVNGYTSAGDLDHGSYYDDERYLPLWRRLAELDVPLYLHPRNPLPSQRVVYAGRPELLGPTWAFGVETATHALRLLSSGLFDRVPGVTVLLGHLGEGLPFAIRRLEQRLARRADVDLARPASAYLRENFLLTTSGNYHTPSLVGIMLELGVDRLLFAADYPFEELEDGCRWLDALDVSEADRDKIAHGNARRLLGLTNELSR